MPVEANKLCLDTLECKTTKSKPHWNDMTSLQQAAASPVPVLVKCEDFKSAAAAAAAAAAGGASIDDDDDLDDDLDEDPASLASTSAAEKEPGYPFSMLEDPSASGVVVQAICPFCFKVPSPFT